MNRKIGFAFLHSAVLLLIFSCQMQAFIRFEPARIDAVTQVSFSPGTSPHIVELVRQLEAITGLQLEIRDSYLRLHEPERLPLLYAGSPAREVQRPADMDTRWSPTARALLLSALRSANVYKVREDSAAALGRVDPEQTIELNFADFARIVYRDLPKETFNAGMIFLHELVHRHLRLKDPTPEDVRRNSNIKGPTVEFLNRIERELGLPERRHYAPVKIRVVNEEPRWGIYFGNETDRVEFDTSFPWK